MAAGIGGFLTFLAFVFLAWVGFIIYFIFKMIQFVIQAADLYKDMVTRLDKIIAILYSGSAVTINDPTSLPSGTPSPLAPTSSAVPTSPPKPYTGPWGMCPNCDSKIPLNSLECPNPKCQAQFGPNSAWKVKPL